MRAAPILGVALAACLAGCAHYYRNDALTAFDASRSYRFENVAAGANSDEIFVCLTFSGGGTRAAALAYGVLEELRRTRIPVGGESRSLLDEVDCISSVSGGSFTTAYYGLFRERLFDDFRGRFLERNIEKALLLELLKPTSLVRVASPWFGRIDLAAELYDANLFDGKEFGALAARGRPFVMINATNMESGGRFEYTGVHFDAMGSDLESFPVSRAVAASSAFPFLLSPVSMHNLPEPAGYEEPWWYAGAAESRHEARRRYLAARELDYYHDKEHAFVHVLDGGLADNIGARALLDAYDRGFLGKKLNEGKIRYLVVLLVNAATDPPQDLSRHERSPSLVRVGHKTATVAMDNYSVESISLLVERLRRRMQVQANVQACSDLLAESCPSAPRPFAPAGAIDPYVLELNFHYVDELGDENEDADYYLSLPTSFRLDAEQVERLVGIGPKLLRAAPQYQCLLAVLEAEAAGAPRPEGCPAGSGISGD